MEKKLKEILIFSVFLIFSLFIFRDYFLENTVPFPANLLGSFYQPWVSYKWDGYPNGPPSKPIGFDNLRTFYSFRKLTIDQIKNFEWPLWNPYNFSGNVHLATYQSAVFHPLSFLFLLLPQIDAWSVIIILQPILGSIFMYLFLREISLSKKSCFFGALAFAFSGITIVWWEEMFMAGYTALLLPLVMLSVEKMYKKITPLSFSLFTLSLAFSVFSGWFQMTFYTWIFSALWIVYLYLKSDNKGRKIFKYYVAGYIIALLIVSIHLLPTIEAYFNSPRGNTDIKSDFDIYLLPLQSIVTFVFPDFFGNPAVFNHFGIGFYHEKIFWVALPGLIFGIYELLSFKNINYREKFLRWAWIITFSLGFSLPTSWFFLYYLKIPLLSVMLPSRIFFLSTFCLCVTAAFGIEKFLQKPDYKKLLLIILSFCAILFFSWSFILTQKKLHPTGNFATVSFRNMIIPSASFAIFVFFIFVGYFSRFIRRNSYCLFLIILVINVLYFSNKYLYFSDRKFVYPETPVVSQLKKISGINRFWGVGNGRIDTNFATYFGLFSPEGYEPFYERRYGELLYSSHNKGIFSEKILRADAILLKAENIDVAFEDKHRRKLLSLLGVKYIVESTTTEIKDIVKKVSPSANKEDLALVWSDDKFRIYEYKKAFPRFFLVNDYELFSDKQKILDTIYNKDLSRIVVLEENPAGFTRNNNGQGNVNLISYSPNIIKFKTRTNTSMILFLSDNYYPGWKVFIDGKENKIYRADYSFRAVVVPMGEHEINFIYKPLWFYFGMIVTIAGILVLVLINVKIRRKKNS